MPNLKGCLSQIMTSAWYPTTIFPTLSPTPNLKNFKNKKKVKKVKKSKKKKKK